MNKSFLNNKGFAISGMLYTLFALFLIIMFSILAMSNFKRNVLIKTTENLEESYTLTKVEGIENYLDGSTTKITGKYVFKTKTSTGADKICTAYLKKGTTIPDSITPDETYENFSLIPEDCNNSNYTISLNSTDEENINKMVLTDVYVFKKNEKGSG